MKYPYLMKTKFFPFLVTMAIIVVAASCSKDDDDNPASPLPSVITGVVTMIKADSALFTGAISSEGQTAVIKRGFCWATHPDPTVSDNFSDNAFGAGNFTHTATGLQSNTIYFVKAYATNGNGTAYGNATAFKTKYQYGDAGPGGGYVFYLDGSGGGLEAAPESTEGVGDWGCVTTSIPGTSTDIGTGQANTTIIVNACPVNNTAAQMCNDLSHNGYTDWYLPSKDELHLMYTVLAANGLGNFTSDRYWSSSEISATSAWREDMILGIQAGNSKFNPYRVRAIRSF